MKRITMILSCLVALVMVADVSAQGRRSRRGRSVENNTVYGSGTTTSSAQQSGVSRTITSEEAKQYSVATGNSQGSENAMTEVNAKRALKGLPALQVDLLLCKAAHDCAKQRAARNIHGHLPESDFSYVHGTSATVGGCGALEDSWGWETCAYDSSQYTVGGAAWVRGPNGLRFMHFFGR